VALEAEEDLDRKLGDLLDVSIKWVKVKVSK